METIRLKHSHWEDNVILNDSGDFRRVTSGCSGRWFRRNDGVLYLDWFAWPSEIFVPETNASTSKAINHYKLLPKSEKSPRGTRCPHPLGCQEPLDLVLVTSIGGTGCTGVLEIIGREFRTNDPNDWDFLKHAYSPDSPRFRQLRPFVIYVWNNPLEAILSLNRREWLYVQCRKLEGMLFAAKDLNTLWKHTLDFSRDLYGIHHHAHQWLSQERWPMYFLDMRQIESGKHALGKLLGADLSALCFHERAKYDLSLIPEPIKEIYADLDTQVQAWGNANNRRYQSLLIPASESK